MFGYLFPSYLYPPCALLFIAPPLQRWRHLWNLQGNVDRLRSHTEPGVLQIKHPNYSHQLALFALQMHPLSAIMNMAPIREPYDRELFLQNTKNIKCITQLNKRRGHQLGIRMTGNFFLQNTKNIKCNTQLKNKWRGPIFWSHFLFISMFDIFNEERDGVLLGFF